MFSENALTCLENSVRWTSPSRSKSFNSTFYNIAIANILHSCCDLLFSVKGQDSAVYVGVCGCDIRWYCSFRVQPYVGGGSAGVSIRGAYGLMQVGLTKAHEDRWKTNRVLDASKTDIHDDGHDVMYVPMKKRCVWYDKSSQHSTLMKSLLSVASLLAFSYHDKSPMGEELLSRLCDHFPPLPPYDRRW